MRHSQINQSFCEKKKKKGNKINKVKIKDKINKKVEKTNN